VETLALFEIKNLTYFYPDCDKPALHNINLKLDEGELLLVVGSSGSGKSSLARVMAGLIPYFYGGKICGRVCYQGEELREKERRFLSSHVGIVFQDPEKQLVMTSVEAEVAFGLENLGLPQQEMYRRLSEVMSFLNLTPLKQDFTANLSGGQKQKVALASVLAMQPRILVLDEPTSQLDPVAADELLNLMERLNKELGYTVVLIEQRLERCFHLADRLLVMGDGEILKDGPVAEVARWEVEQALPFLPPVAKFFATLGSVRIPLTIKDGRKELQRIVPCTQSDGTHPPEACHSLPSKIESPDAMLEAKNLWFTYPNGKEALKGVNCRIREGEFVAILGENAAGKSTFLKQMAGILQPGRGSVTVQGKDTRKSKLAEMARFVGYLSQNPNDYLFQDTVREELCFTLNNLGIPDHGAVDDVLTKLGLTEMSEVNPRDLSSGERQRVALGSVLVAKPKIMLLDEPTRGIDYLLKSELGSLLLSLNRDGITVVVITHDVEFAAEYADRVMMMFDGTIVSDGPKQQVLGGSVFYSPQIARLFKHIAGDVLTVKEGIKILQSGGERNVS